MLAEKWGLLSISVALHFEEGKGEKEKRRKERKGMMSDFMMEMMFGVICCLGFF